MSRTYTIGEFPSRIIRKRRISDFVCTETSYHPGQEVAVHSHESACIVINLQGAFTERAGRREYLCQPSGYLLRPPGDPHSNAFHSNGAKCLTVEISRNWVQWARHMDVAIEQTFYVTDGTISPLSRRLYAEFGCTDSISPLAMEGLILEMIAALCRRLTGKNDGIAGIGADRLRKAQELIHDRFADQLTLTEIANTVDLHPVHLSRGFRVRFGRTVGQYIRELRISRACIELADAQFSLATIALNCGFADQSHFSRVFKQHTGSSPGRYRSRVRQR